MTGYATAVRDAGRAAGRSRRRSPPRLDSEAARSAIVERVRQFAPLYAMAALPAAHLIAWMRDEGWSRGGGEHDLRVLVRAGRLVRVAVPLAGACYRVPRAFPCSTWAANTGGCIWGCSGPKDCDDDGGGR